MADARVWWRALASDRLKAGRLARVDIGSRAVLLARLEDGALAAAAVDCPHEGEDLSRGTVYMGAVDCPRHHYLYDLRTGENRYPKNVFPAEKAARLAALPLFAVKEENGWIWVGEDCT